MENGRKLFEKQKFQIVSEFIHFDHSISFRLFPGNSGGAEVDKCQHGTGNGKKIFFHIHTAIINSVPFDFHKISGNCFSKPRGTSARSSCSLRVK